ncbi:MAG: hypothetical protein HLUCCA04_02705 [Oceanicaulis sp. HLUCCA04]|nr:MAG: hypothetical protein HLUCCA04_02705 [Oceanicaulis sp. HLUCCA04]
MAVYTLQGQFDHQDRTSTSLIFSLFVMAACVLVATAPIYWLPGLPLPVLTAVKNAAFFTAVALAVVVSGARFLQFGIAAPFIIAAVLNFSAFQLNGSGEYAVYQAFTFLAPMAWVLAIRSLSRDQSAILLRYLPLPLGLVMVAAAYALLAKFGAVPDFRPPLEGLQLREYQLSGLARASVSNSGFTFARTGWGTGTGMALVLLGSLLISRHRNWAGLAVLALAVIAPAAMGGRGAAVGAMAAFALAVLYLRQLGHLRIPLILGMAVVPVVSIDYLVSAGILSERFFNIRSNTDWFFMLDAMSTGRLSTWIHAIENFAESPLIGVGVEQSRLAIYTGQVVSVHNAWLAFLSEGGLMAFLPAAFLFFWCLGMVWRIREFRPLIAFVIVISMVEPGVMFGSFGNQVSIWTAVGLAMRAFRR